MPKGYPGRTFVRRVCRHCSKKFKVLIQMRGQKFCSRTCGARNRHTVFSVFWSKVKKTKHCWFWIGRSKTNAGYGRLSFGGVRSIYAHRFSWELHFGKVPVGMLVCHRCDCPGCVRPDHLFLGSYWDNIHDAISKGRMPIGERTGGARLSEKQVLEIRKLRFERTSIGDLAERFKTSTTNIKRIVHRKTWKHLPGEAISFRLTPDQVDKIRILYANGGHTYESLGCQFGVDFTTIYQVVKRKSWKHLP